MDTWHTDTTWEEFAATAPCLVRSDWIAAFRAGIYPTPAALFHDLARRHNAGHDVAMDTIRYLRARECGLYHEWITELMNVVLFGESNPHPLIEDSADPYDGSPWLRTRTEVQLTQLHNDCKANSDELVAACYRVARVKARTDKLVAIMRQRQMQEEEWRNQAALDKVAPRLAITLMARDLMINGMHPVVIKQFGEVYARDGRALVKHRGVEYKVERALRGDGYTGRKLE